MPFPKREWEMLKNNLNTQKYASTIRCCKELNKYKENAIFETPWGDLVTITKINRYSKAEDIPTWSLMDKGMKISIRKSAQYGNSLWDHVIFKKIKMFFTCIWLAIHDAIYHDGVEHAGYLSFLIMLSIFPFLIFFMHFTALLGEGFLGNVLVQVIMSSSWASFIDALKPRIVEITSSPPSSILTLAIASVIWTASSIFEGLRTVLNRAYRVTAPPAYIFRRLLSFVEFFIATICILFIMITLAIIPEFIRLFVTYFKIYNYLGFNFDNPMHEGVRITILYAFTFLLVNYAYYALPNRKSRFRDSLMGSSMVVIAWSIFGNIFTYYIDTFPQVNFIYGSIAGIIIALLYFYFSSLIFIMGGEFNYYFEKKFTRNKH
jgi:membrane protein